MEERSTSPAPMSPWERISDGKIPFVRTSVFWQVTSAIAYALLSLSVLADRFHSHGLSLLPLLLPLALAIGVIIVFQSVRFFGYLNHIRDATAQHPSVESRTVAEVKAKSLTMVSRMLGLGILFTVASVAIRK